ncbi:MAG: hypothetical protein AAFQ40_09005 [Cyanobacteria bacterium J06623_5]
MSNEKKKVAPESDALESAAPDEQLENVVVGNKNDNQKERVGQVSLSNPAADLNGDGNVTLHEVVTFNRDRRDKS